MMDRIIRAAASLSELEAERIEVRLDSSTYDYYLQELEANNSYDVSYCTDSEGMEGFYYAGITFIKKP